MKQTFGVTLTLIGAILASTLGAILFVALWPYLGIVGKIVVGFLAICIGCATLYVLAFTRYKIQMLGIQRQQAKLHASVVSFGDVVAVPQPDGSWVHLSALHEQAKVERRYITEVAVAKEEVPPDELEILSLISQGKSQREVARLCGTNQSRVQKVVARWKEQHDMV